MISRNNRRKHTIGRNGLRAYGEQIENYSRSSANEMTGISQQLMDMATSQNIMIEDDEDTLEHQVKNDIRKNIPPQIYSLISGMIEAIENLEGEIDNES